MRKMKRLYIGQRFWDSLEGIRILCQIYRNFPYARGVKGGTVVNARLPAARLRSISWSRALKLNINPLVEIECSIFRMSPR